MVANNGASPVALSINIRDVLPWGAAIKGDTNEAGDAVFLIFSIIRYCEQSVTKI